MKMLVLTVDVVLMCVSHVGGTVFWENLYVYKVNVAVRSFTVNN